MASTLAHLTRFLYGARLPAQNGATAVLQDVWDAARFVELAEEHRITCTSAATPFPLDATPIGRHGGPLASVRAGDLAAHAIVAWANRSGDADLVIGGGAESMTRVPRVLPKAATASSRSVELHDTSLGWRLVNPRTPKVRRRRHRAGRTRSPRARETGTGW
jgi:hypothetical protein